ncbi:TIR domain-containing protein [Actinokineospora cianjurensis]|uniref:O-acetyl-ADP-ribose deacetylase (Regulator of RNase III) n=1 Tax=Actinokineospora cianjurensis TaxID=585224 RepID=A0A421B5E1_9PSEU|nr:TIR domain-containing protein [Actinokineospora cianjurensis]RLK59611.1 O-acetyl-ADP-ribose deacetylase (regulator of RNase III) [Actinokineospora cianjurensis]
MPEVFVNYRVREDPGYATLLYRELGQRFGSDSVFLAARSIRAGDDYVREAFDRLRECSVLLAVIGERWSVSGERDWVRREIAMALASGIRVVPVLIEDADLPVVADLPDDIVGLVRCQAVRLRHYSFDNDMSALVDELLRLAPALRLRAAGGVAEAQPVRYEVKGNPRCGIAVVPGRIRRVRHIDMWVNSENTDMQMARHNDFSVSAIIRYWGAAHDGAGQVIDDLVADELTAAVAGRRSVAPGTAVVTGAGRLTATNNVRRIIHVASVQGEPGAGFRQVRNVDECVTNALACAEREAAEDDRVRTVLFPLLGVGADPGAEPERTARRMVDAALDHLRATPGTLLNEIAFLGYSAAEFALLLRVLAEFPLTKR